MDETSKTLSRLPAEWTALLTGKGIDIGCGRDPVRPDAQPFDREHGDANHITRHVTTDFDYVFSSHCLEHMADPADALQCWWSLVRPGGALLVIVPDEDLYEQGYWPPVFNLDHRATFTLSKHDSWSPQSFNLAELAASLPGADILGLRLQDQGYRRSRLAHAVWPRWAARIACRLRLALGRRLRWSLAPIDLLYALLRLPIDQTTGPALAQLVLVARKRLA